MLAHDKPTRARFMAGAALAAALCLGAGGVTRAAEAAAPIAMPASASRVSAPVAAPAPPAPAEAMAPSTIGMACFSNACGLHTVGPRDAVAVVAAIKAGDVRAAALAGGTAPEVMAALLTVGLPARPGDPPTKVKADTARFVANPNGRVKLGLSFGDGDGGQGVIMPEQLLGIDAPPGIPTPAELANQLEGRPAGSTAITQRGVNDRGQDTSVIVGYTAPDGGFIPAASQSPLAVAGQ